MSESKLKRLPQGAMAEPARAVEAATVPVVPAVETAIPAMPREALPRPGNPFAGEPDALAVFGAAQAAFARGAEALADEIAGLTRSGFVNATETATAMLGARTLSEAIAVNAGYFRKNLDALLAGSARLSEIGARLTAEALQPLVRG